MTKVLASPIVTQWLDNVGGILGGGFLRTYLGNSTTPTPTWTTSTGNTQHDNPIELDAFGRVQGGIWVTKGTAYKFILLTSALVTIDTLDNVVVGEVDTSDDTEYETILSYAGTPGAQAFMGGETFKRSVTFPIDFDGSGAAAETNPGSDFIISIRLNGVEVGTCTIATTGAATFVTTGGITVPCVDGDTLTFYSPAAVTTGVDFMATLVGQLA